MKKIIVLVLVLILVVWGFVASAQTSTGEIVTDRPDQTESPVLVTQGGFQAETGFFFERTTEQGVEITNIAYSSTLLKYGVNENFEIRLISEYLGAYVQENETKSHNDGFSPLAFGAKIKLSEERGFWPQAALIGHINLKTGSKKFTPSHTAADFRLTFSNTLSEKWSVSYNLGAEWDGDDPQAIFLYTLSVGYSFTQKFAAFIETYSFFPEDQKADNRADGGFTYKINPNLQLDLSGGMGLSSNAPEYFLSTGISFRIAK